MELSLPISIKLQSVFAVIRAFICQPFLQYVILKALLPFDKKENTEHYLPVSLSVISRPKLL